MLAAGASATAATADRSGSDRSLTVPRRRRPEPPWAAQLVVALSLSNLPAHHRARYSQEFFAEMYGMRRRAQMSYAVAILMHSWDLARALSEPDPTTTDGLHSVTQDGRTGRIRASAARTRRDAATRVAALLVLLAFVVAGCAVPPSSPSGTSTATAAPLMEEPSDDALPGSTAQGLDGVIEQWVADGNGTGVTAAVVTPAGSWTGAAGVDAAGGPLVPESAMSIASITKTFTAAQVLLLVDQGLVDLDRPVADYVTLPFDTHGATVRQVLSMRSGLPMDPIDDVMAAAGSDLARSWTMQDVFALIEPNPGRLGQQGGTVAYNNLNYMVLTSLIEQVTGEPYAAVVRRDLIDPAGLARAWVQDAEAPQPPLTVGEASRLAPVVDAAGPYLPSRAWASAAGGAGGMAADAPSIARWGYLLYGGYVIDPELVEQMTTGQDGYGLGTYVWEVDGARIVGHGGDSESYHGILLVWPDSQVGVAVLVPNLAGMHLGTGTDHFGLALQLQDHLTTGSPAG